MVSEPAQELDAQYLSRLLTLRPELSARFGAERSAALPEPTLAARRATVDLLVAWRDARDALRSQDLDETTDAAVDQRVFAASLELLQFSEEEVQLFRADPDLLREPLSLLWQDQSTIELDAEDRFDGLVQRLAALPAYLLQGREAVSQPDVARTRNALDSVHAAQLMLDHLLALADAACDEGELTESLASDVERAVLQVEESLQSHLGWLNSLRASEDTYALGPDTLDHVLYLRGLDIRADEMREVARGMVEELRVEQARLLKNRFADKPLGAALAGVQNKSPQNHAELHSWLQELMQEARHFVFGRDEFPIPTNEELVVERVFRGLSPCSEGAHWLPPRFRSAFATSHLLLPENRSQEELARCCLAELERLVAFHGYPGRHLLQVWSDRSTHLVRAGVPCGFMAGIASTWGLDTISGWSHYAEEWMREAGFRDSPEVRLVTVRNAIRRATLAYVDVSMATGLLRPEPAAALLVRVAGITPEQACIDINACLRTPTASLSALLGKMRIVQLRKEARVAWRSRFSERHFHELILMGGTMPLAYHFELLEGAYDPFYDDPTETLRTDNV